MIVACLHTARSNIALFDAAARAQAQGLVLQHHVHADLLVKAEAAGGLTPAIEAKTCDVLQALSPGVDAIILNCTTLGPAAALAQRHLPIPVLRSDAALAEQTMQCGTNAVVLCTVRATITSTQHLFAEAATATQTRFEIRLIADAWQLFQHGELGAYYRSIAEAADIAFTRGADIVALAQASMAPAANLAQHGKPLTVPSTCLAAVVEALRHKAKAPC